jgi:hypothetical protein
MNVSQLYNCLKSKQNFSFPYDSIDLQYKKYIFELETLAEKNIMAITNSVKIDKYEFSPNYKLTYSQEEINPNLAFITIAGLR